MQVAYTGAGGNVSRYACLQAQRMRAAEREYQGLGGLRLEERIVDAFLAALAPASVEATLAALQETEQAWQRECHQRELLVERARYEAERAEGQFARVEPENRLVARSLEHAWEERLHDLTHSQDELAGFRRRRPTPLSHDDAEWLHRAGSDLKTVWQAPTTTNRDRKRLPRCLISEVVVFVDRERTVADLTIGLFRRGIKWGRNPTSNAIVSSSRRHRPRVVRPPSCVPVARRRSLGQGLGVLGSLHPAAPPRSRGRR